MSTLPKYRRLIYPMAIYDRSPTDIARIFGESATRASRACDRIAPFRRDQFPVKFR